jgi:hypothetical protein
LRRGFVLEDALKHIQTRGRQTARQREKPQSLRHTRPSILDDIMLSIGTISAGGVPDAANGASAVH